jgi:DNA-binding NtrC family response regulator
MLPFKNIRTVVVVDDEAPIRKLVKAVLSTSGFQVIEAQDGKEAWGLIQRGSDEVDVVVTDIRMPEIDGVTLAGWIMKLYPAIPVVLMSGYSDLGTTGLKNPNYRWEFVSKPFLPKTLIGAVNSVLAM